MTKVDGYREKLRTLQDWDEFLLQESGLPGPRGNIELAHAVAKEGDRARFERYRSYGPEEAPVNSPFEFLAFCGVLGLGELLAQGERAVVDTLRFYASDPRWRSREAVAQALQIWGDADMDALLQEMEAWSEGNPLEQRAALCEPRLLDQPDRAERVLRILDRITGSLQRLEDRKSWQFQALRKGLAYCWSVAVAAHPELGKRIIEPWFTANDRDVRWIMKQNLRKKRLERMDDEWVQHWKVQLGM